MLEYLMYIFSEQMCMFGYLKTPDIMLSIVSSQKLDWTHLLTPTVHDKYYSMKGEPTGGERAKGKPTTKIYCN